MKVKILYDSESVNKELSVGWGFSCLVDGRVLFDLGSKAGSLLKNFNKMNLSLDSLESIVISHDHWDHTGGLEDILGQKKKLRVYICPGFSDSLKEKICLYPVEVFEAASFMRVSFKIYSTGEIVGSYKDKEISEQALIVKTEKGNSVITGCAHPGIIEILEKVRIQLSVKEFYAVLGGFHLMNHSSDDVKKIIEKFSQFKVKKVGPTHCTGPEAMELFKKAYANNYYELKVGKEIEI